MFSSSWYLALACQGAIAGIAFIVATIALRVRWTTALLAIAIFNAIPLAEFPGFKSPLYLHDFLTPLAALLVLLRLRELPRGLLGLALFGIFLWPILGIVNSLTSGATGYLWITFLYRRLALAMFLLAGACAFPRLRLSQLLDTYTVLWVGMASVGLMQYVGVLDVDFLWKGYSAYVGESVMRDTTAQHGFLGLVRVAVGACSGAITAYCLANLLLAARAGFLRTALYTVGIVLSVVVILFSGSRSGLVASGVGMAYVGLLSLRQVRHLRTTRLILFGALAVVGVAYTVAPALTVVSQRLEGATESESFKIRLTTYRRILNYVVSTPDAALFGTGFESTLFQRRVNTTLTHAHNEYLQVLWSSGIPGLVLYLLLLYRIYAGMKPIHGATPDVLGVATRGMFVAGLVVGLSEGNVINITSMQYTFGMFMLFAFGARMGQVHRYLIQLRLARRPQPAPAPPRAGIYPLGNLPHA